MSLTDPFEAVSSDITLPKIGHLRHAVFDTFQTVSIEETGRSGVDVQVCLEKSMRLRVSEHSVDLLSVSLVLCIAIFYRQQCWQDWLCYQSPATFGRPFCGKILAV
jgi:hypothetical protein